MPFSLKSSIFKVNNILIDFFKPKCYGVGIEIRKALEIIKEIIFMPSIQHNRGFKNQKVTAVVSKRQKLDCKRLAVKNPQVLQL